MNFVKISKKNFSKFIYRQQFEVFGHKMMFENSNTRKQIAIKLYKLYFRFLDIKNIFRNSKQSNLVKFILGSELIMFLGKNILAIYNDNQQEHISNNTKTQDQAFIIQGEEKFNKNSIKENIENYKNERNKTIRDNKNLSGWDLLRKEILDPQSVFYRSNILDLGVNSFFIFYIGKYLNIINPSAFKKILLGSIVANIGCLIANEKIKNYMLERAEIRNFNVFKDSSFLSKMLISYLFFGFLDYLIINKTVGSGIIQVNRKPIFILISFFIFAKLSNFFSIFTCDTIK